MPLDTQPVRPGTYLNIVLLSLASVAFRSSRNGIKVRLPYKEKLSLVSAIYTGRNDPRVQYGSGRVVDPRQEGV